MNMSAIVLFWVLMICLFQLPSSLLDSNCIQTFGVIFGFFFSLFLGVRWLLKSHYGAKHKMVTSILIGIGAFIIFGTATWLYLEYSAKKFHIFLANANGYLQATSGPKEEDMHRHIVSAESFKISSQPLMLAFGIDRAVSMTKCKKRSIMEVHTQQLGVIAGTWEKG